MQSTPRHGEMPTGTPRLKGALKSLFRNLTINTSYRYFHPLKPLFDRHLPEKGHISCHKPFYESIYKTMQTCTEQSISRTVGATKQNILFHCRKLSANQ